LGLALKRSPFAPDVHQVRLDASLEVYYVNAALKVWRSPSLLESLEILKQPKYVVSQPPPPLSREWISRLRWRSRIFDLDRTRIIPPPPPYWCMYVCMYVCITEYVCWYATTDYCTLATLGSCHTLSIKYQPSCRHTQLLSSITITLTTPTTPNLLSIFSATRTLTKPRPQFLYPARTKMPALNGNTSCAYNEPWYAQFVLNLQALCIKPLKHISSYGRWHNQRWSSLCIKSRLHTLILIVLPLQLCHYHSSTRLILKRCGIF